MTRRILSIGHSYVTGANRTLPNAIALAGGADWEVTVAAPAEYPGDLGPLSFERDPNDVCNTYAIPVHGAGRIHTMRYGSALRALLAQHWDVVHCWEEPFVVSASQVAHGTRPGAALVYATFQNIARRYPPPFNLMERYAMRRASGWIAFGHTVAAALSARHSYARRIHRVIAPGVQLTRFTPDAARGALTRASLRWSNDGIPVVGFIGRFVPEKGWRLLTRALDRITRPWHALFVGGGSDTQHLRKWAEQHGDKVRIVTGVAHHDVPAYLNAMDLLAVPSQTTRRWREQFGRVLVEAAACGVPVVASTSGEIPHVVGDAGILIDENDEAEWQHQIERLIDDAPARMRLAANGIARVRTHFDMDVVAAAHLDFFEELLALRGRSRPIER